MPSYYIPKKDRCPCDGSEINSSCQKPFNLMFATSSSVNSSNLNSKVVYTSYESSKHSQGIGKGEGNTRKMGSGGNSYSDYISRKKGIQLCNCNIKN